MKKVISVTLFALFVLSSFVTVPAQETAGAMPVRPALTDPASTTRSAEPLLTEIYRVGVGDVLDVRLLNSPQNKSTLFTVMPGRRNRLSGCGWRNRSRGTDDGRVEDPKLQPGDRIEISK